MLTHHRIVGCAHQGSVKEFLRSRLIEFAARPDAETLGGRRPRTQGRHRDRPGDAAHPRAARPRPAVTVVVDASVLVAALVDYVAVAEALDVPLATLDARLSRASGVRCRFLTPPGPPFTT